MANIIWLKKWVCVGLAMTFLMGSASVVVGTSNLTAENNESVNDLNSSYEFSDGNLDQLSNPDGKLTNCLTRPLSVAQNSNQIGLNVTDLAQMKQQIPSEINSRESEISTNLNENYSHNIREPNCTNDTSVNNEITDEISDTYNMLKDIPKKSDIAAVGATEDSLEISDSISFNNPSSNEIIQSRTINTKHYDNGDGTFGVQISDEPIHYLDANNNWQDMDTNIIVNTPIVTSNTSMFDFSNTHNNFNSYYSKQSNTDGYIVEYQYSRLQLWLNPRLELTNSDGYTHLISEIQDTEGEVTENKIQYRNTYPDITDELILQSDGIKHNYIIDDFSIDTNQIADSDVYLTFIEYFILPTGFSVWIDSNKLSADFEAQSFRIQSENSEIAYHIQEPIIHEDRISTEEAVSLNNIPIEKRSSEQSEVIETSIITGRYKVHFENNRIQVSTNVPLAWLQDANRVFPVIVDPTVIIGSGTSLYRHPWDIFYNFARSQSIYLSSELGFTGTITRISYYRDLITTGYSIANAQLWMKDTTSSTLSSWQTEGTSVLGPNTWTVSTAEGWYGYDFTTPFNHVNGNNLQISFRHQDGSYSSPCHYYRCTSTSASYRTLVGYSDTVNPPSVSQHYYRPNVYITYTLPPDDSYEENDNLASAYDISTWETTWLNTHYGYGIQLDDDWYRISITPGYEQLDVDLTFTDANGDIDLEVYNSGGSFVTGSYGTADNEYINYLLPSSGTYYLKVYYQNAGNTYNLWWDDLLVPKPDLTVVDIWLSDSTPAGDTSITYYASINNQGTGAVSSSFSIQFLCDYRGTGIQNFIIGTTSVGSLAAGGTTTVSVISSNVHPGYHMLEVHSDSTNTISESNEDNNWNWGEPAWDTYTWFQGPDLIVEDIWWVDAFGTTTTTVTSGQPFTVRGRVRNSGDAAAGSFNVALYIDGSLYGTAPVTSLAVGASIEIYADDVFISSIGSHSFQYIADYSSSIYEANKNTGIAIGDAETNNDDRIESLNVIRAQWTVLSYMDGDNNLEGFVIDDFEDMANGGCSSNTALNIVAQMDRGPQWWDSASGTWQDNTEYGNWQDCYRFFLTTDLDPTPTNCIQGQSMGEVDMGAQATLQSFLTWGANRFLAINYFVILEDHGGSWVGCCWDDTSGSVLNLLEIKNSFSAMESAIGSNIDLVLFDDCLMGSIEVATQIYPHVDYTVVSESIGWTSSLPYDDFFGTGIIEYLKSNPTVTPYNYAIQIVNLANPVNDATAVTQSIAAYDLSKMGAFVTSVDTFATNLKSNYIQYKTSITTARQNSIDMEGIYSGQYDRIIDLYQFTSNVKTFVPDLTIQNSAQDLMNQIGTTSGGTTGCLIIKERHTTSTSFCHGMSIYFPDLYSKYLSSYESSGDFVSGTQWDEFLRAYYNCPPTCQVISPNGGGWYSGTVTVTATASDTDGTVNEVDFYYSLDNTWPGTLIGVDTVSGDGWSYPWNTVASGLTYDSSVWVRAVAYDGYELGWDTSDTYFGIDNIAPTITATTFGDNTVGISTAAGIYEATWSENMAAVGSVTTNLPGATFSRPSATVYRITYTALTPSTLYTITYNGFSDIAGCPAGGDLIKAFTTITAPASTATITNVNPGTPSNDNTPSFTYSMTNSPTSVEFYRATSPGGPYVLFGTDTSPDGAWTSGVITDGTYYFAARGFGATNEAVPTASEWGPYVIDTAAPTITATTFGDNTVGISTTAGIYEATWNENMAAVGSVTTNLPGASFSWSSATVYSITYTVLAPMTTYTITYNGFTDLAGNSAGGDLTKVFTTAAPATATATGPTGGPSTVAAITIAYTWIGTPTSVNLYYTTNGGTTWTLAGNDATVDGIYAFTCPAAGTYGWIASAVGGGSVELSPPTGGTVPEAASYIFDNIRPTITNTIPASGATIVAIIQNIVITFNEPINTGTFAYTVLPNPGGLVVTWSGGNTIATISHTAFAYGTAYTVTVTVASDPAGNLLNAGAVPNPWSFTAVFGPTATATGPTNAVATNVASITITYSYTGAPTSVNLYYTTNGGTTWSLAGNDATVDSSYSFTCPIAGTYGWIASAVGGGSVELSPPTGGTVPEVASYLFDNVRPTITVTNPINGATGVSITSPVVVTFSEAMNTASVTYTCAPNPGGWIPSWNVPTNTILTLTHTAFAYSTLYTFTITAGTDVAGNLLNTGTVPNPWTFTTTAPNSATATGPTGSSSNPMVTITYTWTGSPTSVTLYYSPDGVGWIPAGTDFSVDGSFMFFCPSPGYYYWMADAGEVSIWMPEAGPYIFDNVRPTITNTVPASGTTLVALNSTIVVTFSEAMNTASVTYTCAPLPVGGFTVVWSGGNTIATYSHATAFAYSTLYTFTITAGSDLAGNLLNTGAVPNPWSFTTVAPAPVLTTIVITPNPISLPVSTFVTVTAQGYDQYGATMACSPAWADSTISGVFSLAVAGNPATVRYTAGATPRVFTLDAITATDGTVHDHSNLTITYTPVLSAIVVTPDPVSVATGASIGMTAQGLDQFGFSMACTPVWANVQGGGSWSLQVAGNPATATYTAGLVAGGPWANTITATQAAIVGNADLTITGGAGNPLLTIIKTAPATANPGELISYTITCSNIGTDIAYNVMITELYPPEVMYVSSIPAPTFSNNVWAISTLAPGASLTITITVQISPMAIPGAVLVNWVTVDYENGAGIPQPPVSDNASTLITSPGMIITKWAPLTAFNGESITYWINYSNIGTDWAYNVVITEIYPVEVTFISCIPAPTFGNNVWNIGTVAPGGSGSIQITVLINPSFVGIITNRATLDYENALGMIQPQEIATADTMIALQFQLQLNSGWNLISIPLIPNDRSLDAIFGANLTGGMNQAQSDKVFKWNPLAGTWQVAYMYEVGDPILDGTWMFTSGAFTIEPDVGYWVWIREDLSHPGVTINIFGALPGERSLPLSVGWNLVGYTSVTSVRLQNGAIDSSGLFASGFTGGTSQVTSDRVLGWSGTGWQVQYMWQNGVPSDGTWLGTTFDLAPGRGYWIEIRETHEGFTWNYGG